ncbi:Crp/Fnr family transcriptional regulator [Aminobacter sp. Piv2-1]|uniref:Crp/Fnr family transcriptional regulator n=1 Tax=Aminobacter sp. Piv2-1 TaxID=3031122 RepID=UPI0030B53E0B
MAEQTLLQFFQSLPTGIALGHAGADVDFLDSTARTYATNTVVGRQGDTNSRIFIVQSGWTSVCRHLPNGNRQIIDTPLKGDVLDLPSADGGSVNSLLAVTAATIFEIPGHTFAKALDRNATLGALFSRMVARQHQIAAERLTSVCRRSALERTAHFLLELGERLAAGGAYGTQSGYDCPLTQHDLADVLGLTQIHVNRTLRELRERDMVSFRSGSVEFLNRQKLVKLAGFDKGYLQYSWPQAPQKLLASGHVPSSVRSVIP